MMREFFYRSVRGAADAAWTGFQWVNRKIPAREFQPAWAPEPLPKSHQRSKPPLGFPRRTDSLCPACTKEVRDAKHDNNLLVVKFPSTRGKKLELVILGWYLGSPAVRELEIYE